MRWLKDSASSPLSRAVWAIGTLAFVSVGVSACRLSSNNNEKLQALRLGETYDEDGLLDLTLTSPIEGTLINRASSSANYPTSGTCTVEGATIKILIDGIETQSEAVCTGGSWSHSFDSTAISDGEHPIAAKIIKSNGKEKTSASVKFTKNTAEPQLAILSPLTGSYINSSSDSATFAVSGTCSELGQSVSVKVDDSAATAMNGGTCNGSTWAATISTVGLSAGAHTLRISMSSVAGNTKTSDPVVVTKDVTAPSASIGTPAANSYVNLGNNSATFAVSGTCNDSTASVQVKVDGSNSGSPATCSGTAWNASISTVALNQGAHTLTAQIADPAGNSATSSAITITKDTVAPTIAITSPTASSYVNIGTNSSTFGIQGSCTTASESGRTITIQVNGSNATQSAITCGASNAWSGTFSTTSLAEATHTLTALISDAAGNSTTSSGIAVIKDTVVPTVTLTLPVAGATINPNTNSSTYLVRGACSENSSAVTVRVDGSTATGLASNTCSSGAFSATIDTTGLTNAVHTITAVMSDAAGNTGPATPPSVSITKDTTLAMGATFGRTGVAHDPYMGVQSASGVARYPSISSATGVMVEESTTNFAGTNSNMETDGDSNGMADGVYNYVGTQSRSLSTTAWVGSKAQALYADGTYATPRVGFDVATTAGTTYTYSAWCKSAAGNTLLLNIKGRNSGGSEVWSGTNVTATATGSYQRLSVTTTPPTDGSAVTTMFLFGLAGTPAAGTEAICDAFQVEAKPYATSWTDGTRSAETMSIPTSGSLIASQGAVIIRAYVTGERGTASSTKNYWLFSTGNYANANAIGMGRDTGAYFVQLWDNSSASTRVNWSSPTLTTGWHTFGMRWNSGELSLWVDGVSKASTTTVSLPASMRSSLFLGSLYSSTDPWSQPMDSIAMYQRAPSDAEMGTFTSTGATDADNFLDFHGVTLARSSVAYDPFTVAQTASGAARYSESGNGRGLTIETAATNLITYSDPTQANCTTKSNTQDTNFGALGLTQGVYYPNNSVTSYANQYPTLSTSTYYTLSVFVKMDDGSVPSPGGSSAGDFSLVIANTVVPAGQYKVQSIGNGVYRVSGGLTTPATISGANTGIYKYTGQSTKAFKASGFQLEAREYATSFILTSGSTVTRASDNITVPHANLISASSGAVRARFMIHRPASASSPLHFVFDAGGTGNTALAGGITQAGYFQFQAGNGSGNVFCYSTTQPVPFTWYTVEYRWAASQLTLKVNGTTECNNTTTFSNGIVLNASGLVYIGSNQNTVRWLDGTIDWMEFENSDGSTKRLDFNNSLGQ